MKLAFAIIALPLASLAMDQIPQSANAYYYSSTNGWPVSINGGIMPVRSVTDRTLRGEDWMFLTEAVMTRLAAVGDMFPQGYGYIGVPSMFQATNTDAIVSGLWERFGRGYSFTTGESEINELYANGGQLSLGADMPDVTTSILPMLIEGCGWTRGQRRGFGASHLINRASVSNLFADIAQLQCTFAVLPFNRSVTIVNEHGGDYLEYYSETQYSTVEDHASEMSVSWTSGVTRWSESAFAESVMQIWVVCGYQTSTSQHYPYDQDLKTYYAVVPAAEGWLTRGNHGYVSLSPSQIVSSVIAAANIETPRPSMPQGDNPQRYWVCWPYGVIVCFQPKHTCIE